MSKATRTIVNSGKRRVIIGRGPKSKCNKADADKYEPAASRVLRFDTNADEGVPAEFRIGSSHEITSAEAERIEGLPVFRAMKDTLGLRVS